MPRTRTGSLLLFLTLFAILLFTLGSLAAQAQLTPTGDAYTNTALPTTNFGAKTLLDVQSASQTTYIRFDLSALPLGYTSANITKATLKLYVNSVTTAGSFNVDFVNGTWAENTINANNAPALGSTIAASVPLTTAEKNQYVLIDITSAVGAWLNGTDPNDGIAVVGNSPLNATFDSKENTTTSHPAELDLVFAGGTITGVNTAGGSGLTGGGTSGTLNLALTSSCAANQVLQWNGSSWACASVGMGTITGVTAGTDLTGGGTSGSITLNVDTTKVAQLSANNTFTGNQTVNGNLSATGVVTGSGYQIGSNLFGFGSYANANAFLGFAGNAATTGANNTGSGYLALFSTTTGSGNTAYGALALSNNVTDSNNTALGFDAGSVFGSGDTFGSGNTFVGAFSRQLLQSHLNNATAIGANAEVDVSNALVLGSINGVNGASADTYVGIGTTGPQTFLHVNHAPPGGGLDLVEVTSGGATDVGSLIIQNTSAGGKRLRVGAGTGVAYLASSGALNLVTADTGSPSNPNPPALAIDASGNVSIKGNLSKGGGSFKIDHPVDPANKYLYHSFVESPDMMNVYNGNITTDKRGLATVTLPDYFEALNRDFRYQLTVIGQFAQAIVAKEISRNRFTIRTNRPGVKVSWQVTGIRHDAYAEAYRIPVEEDKSPQEQGKYLHPELYGASPELAIGIRHDTTAPEAPVGRSEAKMR